MATSQATQTNAAPDLLDSDGLPAGERLSLAEMTRIMDVAATLRKERAVVEQQLNIDQIKAKLRERLLEAAKVSGDPVTAAEIDAAVEQYYDRLHEFQEPPASFATFLAHCWVRRGIIIKTLLALAVAAALFWSLLAAGMLPGEARDRQMAAQRLGEIQHRFASVEQTTAAIGQLSSDSAVNEEVAALLTSARTARDQQQGGKLNDLAKKLQAIQSELEQEYAVLIVNAPGEQSAIERKWTDESGTRTSGFFVLVDALDKNDHLVRVPIRNRESDRTEAVSRWGEQVPEAVFNRLAADKRADGVLDERLFGKKPRGSRQLNIELRGENGEPIQRQGQITSWK